jgi:hypothetical protein
VLHDEPRARRGCGPGAGRHIPQARADDRNEWVLGARSVDEVETQRVQGLRVGGFLLVDVGTLPVESNRPQGLCRSGACYVAVYFPPRSSLVQGNEQAPDREVRHSHMPAPLRCGSGLCEDEPLLERTHASRDNVGVVLHPGALTDSPRQADARPPCSRRRHVGEKCPVQQDLRPHRSGGPVPVERCGGYSASTVAV